MVSTITTGTAGAAALGVDPRYARQARETSLKDGQSPSNDQVQLGDAAAWRAARDSVSAGLDQINATLSLGQDAKDFLNQVQTLANSSDPDAGAQLQQLVSAYAARASAVVKQGAGLAGGNAISVQAEPGAPNLTIAGLNLQLSDAPDSESAITVPSSGAISGDDLVAAARASLANVNAGLDRLSDSARSLTAHQGFLGAAEGAGGVRGDLDADSARLLALQVRQGLDAVGGAPIANVEPQAVLALFKA